MTRIGIALTLFLALGGCWNPDTSISGPEGDGDESGDAGTEAADGTEGGSASGSQTGPTASSGSETASATGPGSTSATTATPETESDSGAESESEAASESASSGEPVDPCADHTCVHGTCSSDGSTAVCECDFGYGGDTCDAIAQPFCLRGTLTVDDAFDSVNGSVATGAFEHLEGSTIEFSIAFDVPDSSVLVGENGQMRLLEAEVVDVWFDDDFMNDTVGAAYVGMAYDELALIHGTSDGIDIGNFVSPDAAEYWGIESSFTELPLEIDDATGFPLLFPTDGEGTGTVYLRRYIPQSPYMTDFAMSSWTIALQNGDDC